MAELKQDILRERNRLRDEVSALKDQNSASQSLVADMDRRSADIMKSREEYASAIEALQSRVDELGKDLSVCRHERDGLRKELTAVMVELKVYRTGFSGAIDAIATARVAIVSLQEKDD